ncbi:Ribonuclease R [Candidatus Kinetoplastibacterium sorsogonicusi]|uniref:Ribonuclease R n=1 Tax=Candidatus Kinetoplastidibacterium kentomonadis TaxID=1576550 RepID=A0A3S7JAJ9_9PROT|nr:ribonuclease catalytic domain-containing protein [Candidatus Kinetoplastibacterium sorsogonicusi]AWD32698.1 Ribonuclease R [Candidatus Kinetoplastibacterium sorsogonicusi]
MFIIFENKNNFLIGKILSETENYVNIEYAKGNRLKLKKNNILLRFNNDTKNLDHLILEANNLSETLDPDFIWEYVGCNEFNAIKFAKEYYGDNTNIIEILSMLIFLNKNPAYFYKIKNGDYKPANENVLKKAIIAINKKKEILEQIERLSKLLIKGILPEEIKKSLGKIISLTDKNSIEYKAIEKSCFILKCSPEKLLMSLGAWNDTLSMHKQIFFAKNPCYIQQKNDFSNINDNFQYPTVIHEYIYSVDDQNTIEIDDALSVNILDNNNIKIGIHIAAPGLGVTRNSEYDRFARIRSSTIYLPGEKITMQPENVINIFSLDQNKLKPAISLYVIINTDTNQIQDTFSCIEKIIVKENLRIHNIENIFNIESLNNEDKILPYQNWIKPLWKVSQIFAKKREIIRGKPENNSKQEYDFILEGLPNDKYTKVHINKRSRNSPISMIISEFMILANTIWGDLLKKYSLPAIYRYVQYGKAKNSIYPNAHDGLGVSQYLWSTSPLRRYIDLVNQWQIISAIEHGISSKLFSTFRHGDSDLFSIMSIFESQYSEIIDFQQKIEKYWCIRWLQQNNLHYINAEIIRDKLVRFLDIPIIIKLASLPTNLSKGEKIELEILGTDEISLDIDCRYKRSINKI